MLDAMVIKYLGFSKRFSIRDGTINPDPMSKILLSYVPAVAVIAYVVTAGCVPVTLFFIIYKSPTPAVVRTPIVASFALSLKRFSMII
jgi:hypothetical protein